MDAQDAASQPVATFLVEGYWPLASTESFAEATARLEASLDGQQRLTSALRAVAATLVPQEEAAYWVVKAASADVVAAACMQAGLPFERIVAAVEIRAEGADPTSASAQVPVPEAEEERS